MARQPSNRGSDDISNGDMKPLQRLRMATSIVAGDTDCSDANILLPFGEVGRADCFETSRASVLGDVEAILRRRGRREGSTKIMVMATLLFDQYSTRWAHEFNPVDYKLLALGCMCIAWKQCDGSKPSNIKALLPKWCSVKGLSEVMRQISANIDCARVACPIAAVDDLLRLLLPDASGGSEEDTQLVQLFKTRVLRRAADLIKLAVVDRSIASSFSPFIIALGSLRASVPFDVKYVESLFELHGLDLSLEWDEVAECSTCIVEHISQSRLLTEKKRKRSKRSTGHISVQSESVEIVYDVTFTGQPRLV
ncbi:hypothetical protein THAOC_16139 [Thalassiosira oceanica]|uniref:Cyclin N-terminal domain-containing protein n=1 Tax=Thalassiosira oceanica TaxID=159749 RepID=K0SAW9_THAOC|nr:hypothetical protein THAOC_16139 [Thalassiosira oceanica]|eukprot:EJK63218.1 hypothetical protein THAOC_16139 [Thalassiosira oceanica]